MGNSASTGFPRWIYAVGITITRRNEIIIENQPIEIIYCADAIKPDFWEFCGQNKRVIVVRG